MKRFIASLGVLFLLIAVPSCQDDTTRPESAVTPLFELLGDDGENTPPDVIPAATVELMDFPAARLLSVEPQGTISPAEVYAILQAGESFTEAKDVYLPAGILPELADVVFALDLTGSMGDELNNVKVNSTNIMNTINGVIDDAKFGVMSHMDYPDFTASNFCGYTGTYGSSASGDYAYSLDEALTATTGDVTTAINGLSLGNGRDGPENYGRVMWEAANDGSVGWRTDAAKFLVYWQDDRPHDCAYGLDCGPAGSTGPDPGPNGVYDMGGDDIVLSSALTDLADEGITLVSLHSGTRNALWDCYAAKTGGSSFQINSNGTIPGGTDIADFILQKIQEVFEQIDVLELVPDDGFEAWVASDPIYDVDLGTTNDFDFDVLFTVPGDAEPGIYNFQLCVYADGAALDVCQDVQIVVYDPSAGFVTGGGWIDSPEGAYGPEASLTGKATFGFVSKYKKGADTPDGNTEFQFHAAGMNFHSSSYEFLVVTHGGTYAQFKGEGTINGMGDYKFMLWAGDDDPDTFRIKIWEEDGLGVETVVYDNSFDQAIAGGSIVIHTKGK